MNAHLFLRQICQYNLPLVAFLFSCFDKGIHVESREQTEEKVVLDEWTLNAEQDVALQSYFVLKNKDSCRDKFP